MSVRRLHGTSFSRWTRVVCVYLMYVSMSLLCHGSAVV